MAVEQIDLVWIAKKMEPNKWYKIKTMQQYAQYEQLINKAFGWPVFQLSLSSDYKFVKKTMI